MDLPLNLYLLDTQYINYLKQFDNDVCEPKDKLHQRPYVGILVFSSGSFNYFAPLTSQKNKPSYYCIKIKNNNGEIIAGIRMNNMIPVKKEDNNIFKKIDINELLNSDEPKDIKYGNLLKEELDFINKVQIREIIKRKAKYFYFGYKYNNGIQNLCCNFKLLEEKALEFTKDIELKKDIKDKGGNDQGGGTNFNNEEIKNVQENFEQKENDMEQSRNQSQRAEEYEFLKNLERDKPLFVTKVSENTEAYIVLQKGYVEETYEDFTKEIESISLLYKTDDLNKPLEINLYDWKNTEGRIKEPVFKEGALEFLEIVAKKENISLDDLPDSLSKEVSRQLSNRMRVEAEEDFSKKLYDFSISLNEKENTFNKMFAEIISNGEHSFSIIFPELQKDSKTYIPGEEYFERLARCRIQLDNLSNKYPQAKEVAESFDETVEYLAINDEIEKTINRLKFKKDEKSKEVEVNRPKNTKEFQDKLVADFIKSLDEPAEKWVEGWSHVTAKPQNAVSGRPYTGVNALQLYLWMYAHGESDPRFSTFEQIQKAGLHVKKGQSAENVLRVGFMEVCDHDTDKILVEPLVKRPIFEKEPDRYEIVNDFLGYRYYPLFHASQIEGIKPFKQVEFHNNNIKVNDYVVEALYALNLPLKQHERIEAPYYDSKVDEIHIPKIEKYYGNEELAVDILHEMIHATGHPNRLNRESMINYGKSREIRAKEELVAEIGAVMTRASAGIKTISQEQLKNHKAYCQYWKSMLSEKDGYKQLEEATFNASRASEYVVGKTNNRIKDINELEGCFLFDKTDFEQRQKYMFLSKSSQGPMLDFTDDILKAKNFETVFNAQKHHPDMKVKMPDGLCRELDVVLKEPAIKQNVKIKANNKGGRER